jgi:hypothetical protein
VRRSVSGGLRGTRMGLRGVGKIASPLVAKAERFVTPRVVGAVRETSTNLRDRAATLRSTVARSHPHETNTDVEALSRRLRDVRL